MNTVEMVNDICKKRKRKKGKKGMINKEEEEGEERKWVYENSQNKDAKREGVKKEGKKEIKLAKRPGKRCGKNGK